MTKQIEAKNKVVRRTTMSISMKREKLMNTQGLEARRITTREMDEKRAKGSCFRCNSKWSQGHKCAEKRLFIIEDNNEGDEEETP